jgi:Apea-like HEPN
MENQLASPPFAIAIFPFLKTSGPIAIGGHTFRSTNDLEGLQPDEATAVGELSQMLFVHGDLRVKSASYALIQSMDIHGDDQRLTHLARLRGVLCYLYGSPHETMGYVALSPEQLSLAIVIPDKVETFITRCEHHTESIGANSRAQPDTFGRVPGYRGIYNFRHYFWLESGTRLYAPTPNLALNVHQDLRADLSQDVPFRPDYRILPALLNKPPTPAALRNYAAVEWYNRANESDIDIDRSLLNLAIAFEALLGLPQESKTDRLADAIALLLGRVERLEIWAKQFYEARCRVAHEGRLGDPHFYADPKKRDQHYGSLTLYGRQIFRLCLCTLLVGIDVTERADLQEKLVSNRERYERIVRCLDSTGKAPNELLLKIEPLVRSLQRYHFVAEGSYPLMTIMGAVQRASACLLNARISTPDSLKNALSVMSAFKRSEGTLSGLRALHTLEKEFKAARAVELPREAAIVADLATDAWIKVAPNYIWLEEEEKRSQNAE